MDKDKLEKYTYEALRKYFRQEENEVYKEGRLLSAIPPEMLNAVMEMLVAPVMAAVVADYIIQKYTSCKTPKIDCTRVEELKSNAEKKIKKKMKKAGKGEKESKKMVQKVSAEITVKIEFQSVHEMNACIDELERLLQEEGKLKKISVDKKFNR